MKNNNWSGGSMKWIKKIAVDVGAEGNILVRVSADEIPKLFNFLREKEEKIKELSKFKDFSRNTTVLYLLSENKVIFVNDGYEYSYCYLVDLTTGKKEYISCVGAKYLLPSRAPRQEYFFVLPGKGVLVRYLFKVKNQVVDVREFSPNPQETIKTIDKIIDTIEKILNKLSLERYIFTVYIEPTSDGKYDLSLYFSPRPLEFVISGKYCAVHTMIIKIRPQTTSRDFDAVVDGISFGNADKRSECSIGYLNSLKLTLDKLANAII